jgi:CTP:molybdopterin cytidylyltransferase MocA
LIGGIVLAAGEGRRFGGPKQLAKFRGRPLLEYAIEAQSRVPGIERIVVVLGAHADQVVREVDLLDAEPVVCDRWAEGQAASLQRGLDELTEADAVIVTLGDQPGITPQVVAMILDQVDSPALAARAVYGGRPGHPVMIKRELFPRVRELRGDVGARPVLEEVGARAIEAGHLCDPRDVDTPEDLAEVDF